MNDSDNTQNLQMQDYEIRKLMISRVDQKIYSKLSRYLLQSIQQKIIDKLEFILTVLFELAVYFSLMEAFNKEKEKIAKLKRKTSFYKIELQTSKYYVSLSVPMVSGDRVAAFGVISAKKGYQEDQSFLTS